MTTQSRTSNALIATVLVYTAVVLIVDTCAAFGSRFPIDWTLFRWQTRSGFDAFKFTAWFLVPFLVSAPTMDWGYFGVRRWKRSDWLLLPALALLACLALGLIPFLPSLRHAYPGISRLNPQLKWEYATHYLLWTLSWIVGWEFLHRYALLRTVLRHWPRYGWIIVPVYEGLYHLQKPPLEALGMVLFSIAATQWALRRQNLLLPFFVHLALELSLLAVQLIL